MQGISNYPCCKSFEYHRLSFAFIFTLPQYLMKKFICFDTYLGTCPTVFPILSFQAIACLSCTRVDDSSSLLAFLISPSLCCQSLEKSGTHERKIGFFFVITSRNSLSTFPIIISIDQSILYVLFRVFITARCRLKYVCM